MPDFLTDALAILVACLVIAAVAIAVVVFRPSSRRRRRRNRHSGRPKIDLFKPGGEQAEERLDA